MIKEQSFLSGFSSTSTFQESNASSRNPGLQLTELDHFLINDGFGKGIIDRTYS